MMQDFLHTRQGNIGQSLSDLLNDLNQRFYHQDKNMLEYGFPEPPPTDTELDRELLKYDVEQQRRLFDQLCAETPLTEEMEELFREIVDALEGEHRRLFFIQGQGGSGKTTFNKKVMAYARSLGKIALGCASTGLAAQNYTDFTTAHSLFKIPVVDDEELDHDADVQSLVTPESQRGELLKAADLIVWDEFPSNHKHCFGAAYNVTNSFYGKVVLCVGDWKQIAPVVVNGNLEEIISAHIFTSTLWRQFEVFTFSKNLRLHDLSEQLHQAGNEIEIAAAREDIRRQKEYAEMLLQVGNGLDYTDNLV